MQIQISWLLQKPTDLYLHCLQSQGISRFSRTRVDGHYYKTLHNSQNDYLPQPLLWLVGLRDYMSKENVWELIFFIFGNKAATPVDTNPFKLGWHCLQFSRLSKTIDTLVYTLLRLASFIVGGAIFYLCEAGHKLSSVLITTGNTFYRSCFKYKWTIGKKSVSFTLMKFLGTASMAAGRPCGDPTTMFLPYVRNCVHTYFEFFSSFTEGPVFNEHCILIATITVCQFIQNKTFGLSTMICPTEKSAHIYLLALRLVWYPANIDWRMTGRCHVKATPSDTNRAYNEWNWSMIRFTTKRSTWQFERICVHRCNVLSV